MTKDLSEYLQYGWQCRFCRYWNHDNDEWCCSCGEHWQSAA